MLEMLITGYRPHNYSFQELRAVLEKQDPVKKKREFILKNWHTMSSKEIAKELGIGVRTVFKLVKGIAPKKKHVVRKRKPPGRSGDYRYRNRYLL